ncbi:hypothetical protein CTEN210_02468 [Chaetoceros tenuissimus]|uniref:Uncharacterized protein n=1 Tax=Chaetoceros tenuissimus TaxID=426638 RepID=A0AAD3H139_9STRA|nr:hypothetical protein CTEN210_02468 [Chaetoceros tenuissimus]
MSSWQNLQGKAKEHYSRNEYDDALRFYLESYNVAKNHAPRSDCAILLSNIVACRLKINANENETGIKSGVDHLAKALEEAKECTSMNKRWAKGFLRLASVYVAMGNRNNDACQALQTAITIDPTNQKARAMLRQELMKHDRPRSNGSSNRSDDIGDAGASTSDDEFYQDVDDAVESQNLSIVEIMKKKANEMYDLYMESSENTQSAVKIFLFLLVLYIAFGGRFGLGSSKTTYDEMYGSGQSNAYERFYSNDWGESANSQRSNQRPNHRDHYGGSQYSTHSAHGYHDYGSSYNSSRSRSYGYGNEYNLTLVITIIVIFFLRHQGIPIHMVAPMGFGGMRFGGMRGMYGRGGMPFGGMRFGGGGFGGGFGGFGRHFNYGGFRVPHRRMNRPMYGR